MKRNVWNWVLASSMTIGSTSGFAMDAGDSKTFEKNVVAAHGRASQPCAGSGVPAAEGEYINGLRRMGILDLFLLETQKTKLEDKEFEKMEFSSPVVEESDPQLKIVNQQLATIRKKVPKGQVKLVAELVDVLSRLESQKTYLINHQVRTFYELEDRDTAFQVRENIKRFEEEQASLEQQLMKSSKEVEDSTESSKNANESRL